MAKELTEERIREIVREELHRAMVGEMYDMSKQAKAAAELGERATFTPTDLKKQP